MLAEPLLNVKFVEVFDTDKFAFKIRLFWSVSYYILFKFVTLTDTDKIECKMFIFTIIDPFLNRTDSALQRTT